MRPGTEYEGTVTYAAGEVVSLQCSEGRHGECPDDLADEDRTERNGPLNGYHCECTGCDHEPEPDDIECGHQDEETQQ